MGNDGGGICYFYLNKYGVKTNGTGKTQVNYREFYLYSTVATLLAV